MQDVLEDPNWGHNQSVYSQGENIEEFLYDKEIAKRVERDKLTQIFEASQNLRKRLAKVHGRCQICTLRPPCKHSEAAATDHLKQDSIFEF